MTTTTREDLVARADELLVAAFDGSLETLNNPAAPPTSKTTATTNAIRLYEILRGDEGPDKEASEMTYDELQAQIRRLQKLQAGEVASDDN